MRDLVIAGLAVLAFWFYGQAEVARDARDEAVASVEAMARIIQIEREKSRVDGELMKGGDDENLSDYGRDAAGILWPEGD